MLLAAVPSDGVEHTAQIEAARAITVACEGPISAKPVMGSGSRHENAMRRKSSR